MTKTPVIGLQQRDALLRIWKETLGIEVIDLDSGFADQGGTSLLANEFVARLSDQLGVTVPVMLIFEYPTLRLLLRFLTEGIPSPPPASAVRVVDAPPVGPAAVRASHDIAIVGMACRFPGARNLAEFWANLLAGRDSITALGEADISPDVPRELLEDPRYVRAAGLIDQPYAMDAPFFGISPMEARLTDPQQRVLLELSWQALEHAGESPGPAIENTAVFAGVEDNTYYKHDIAPFPDAEKRAGRFAVMTGNEKDYVAMRIAYRLNLKGPAVSVHTACSTSLVAVIMACRSLRQRECDMALAGGASVHFPTPEGYYYQEGGVFSSDGHCRPFDRDSQGTNFTDGAGMVVLKRVDDALRDRNTIFAVIRGGAINSDGGDKVSFSAPSVSGQASCIRAALADADVDAGSIQFVEAHGTATPIGDPIELEGLRQAFANRRDPARLQYCGLGSVKSNIGHTTAAAGVASLIKTAFGLHHGVIPGTAHFRSPNPRLELDSSPFYIVADKLDWPRGDPARRAGISSFGIGGTNAHVILEEAPTPRAADPVAPGRPFEIWPVSAKSAAQRDELVARLTAERFWPRDVAYTLQHGRAQFAFRGARVRLSHLPVDDLVVAPQTAAPGSARLVFMFPGQGAQYVGMGKSLYGQLPEFRATFDRCCEVLSGEMQLDFRALIFDAANPETLQNTRYTQPALFAIEVSLGRMLLDWGIRPDLMLGHSIGEFAAAHLAGVFGLDDALKLIAARGRLMSALPAGRMLSVRGALADVIAAAAEAVDVATINSPVHCVLAGEDARIARVQARLEAAGFACRPLHTSHAFHSDMMSPVVEPFLDVVRSVTLHAPQMDIISTVTAAPMTAAEGQDPFYWANHLRATVQFSPALRASLQRGGNTFLEVGPRATLATLAVQHFAQDADPAAARVSIAMLADQDDAAAELGGLGVALAKLWCAGVDLPWQRIWSGGRKVPLASTYPFERRSYRFSEGRQAQARVAPAQPAAVVAVAAFVAEAAAPTAAQRLQAELAVLCCEYSGLAFQRDDASFIESGFDSLALMQIGVQIGKRYDVSVALRDLMEKVNTLPKLAAHIVALAPAGRLPAPAAAPPPAPASSTGGADDGSVAALSRQLAAMRDHFDLQIGQLKQQLQAAAPVAAPVAAALIRARHADPLGPGMSCGADQTVATTAAQREIFSASQLNAQASLSYNHTISIFFDAPVDVDALYSALLNLIQRHEALRGRFAADGSTFIVRERMTFRMPVVDLRGVAGDERQPAYERFIRSELDHVFDLLEGPLFRATLVLRHGHETVLVFNCHHAVVDGWSLKIILDELPRLYTALLPGATPLALAEPTSYLEYLKLAGARETASGAAIGEYWRGVYADGVPVLDLPLDHARPRLRDYASLREDYRIDRQSVAGLKAVGAACGASQFVALLSVYAIYLHRQSGQADLVIGVPAAGQIASGKASLLGHDARIMPIRCTLAADDTFASYAQRLRGRFLSAYEHQWISMPELLRELKVEFEPSRVPLVSVLFNFDPGFDTGQLRFGDVPARHVFNPRQAETFEQSVNAVVEGEELLLEWVYNRTLFDPHEMHARLAQFEQLLQSIVATPDLPVAQLRMLPPAQAIEMDAALNSTAMEFERDLCVDELIERSVGRAPLKTAVECGGQQLTYGQLWHRSGQIARVLIAAGGGPGRIVGVMMRRSADLVAALLGVWRAGGAFVPMDPDYPADRLDYMVAQSGMQVLLSDQALQTGRWRERVRVVDVGAIPAQAPCDPDPRPVRRATDLAYVIYTSGSTGMPKGVPIPHRALNNLLTSMVHRAPGVSPHERLLAVTTLSFDIAEAEIWMPLVAGATTVLADRATVMDGRALAGMLRDRHITMLQATPGTWRTLLFGGWPGDRQLTAICGGEALPPDLAADLVTRTRQLWNAYGPTEATVWATFARLDGGPVTIGRPAGNYQVYVLDEQRAWMPRGCIGELWIGGEGVAPGYLKRDDLSGERFVPNPFTGRGLMYRTGDLVRLGRDGNLDYIGRNDFQVKVRGFRIELGEVQLALSRLPKIRQCVVVVRERRPGDTHLVAYYTVSDGQAPAGDELREGLQASLPAYMIPVRFVQVQRFPQTDNGKIDVKALPDPFATAVDADDAPQLPDAPRTALEIRLAQLWCGVLQLPCVGLHDNFFDVGGHSLLAVRMMSQVREEFGIEASSALLLEHPTVGKLALALQQRETDPVADPDLLVQLKKGRDRNLFFVHDADGDVFLYRELARTLPASFAVFGLIPQQREHVPLVGLSLAQMAAQYVATVRRRQPAGPYYLGGLCAGGVLAFEMATQLERAGQSVELVVIMDALEPRAFPSRQRLSKRRWREFFSAVFPRNPASSQAGPSAGRTFRPAFAMHKIAAAAAYECRHIYAGASIAVRFQLLRWLTSRQKPWPRAIPPLTAREIYLSALKSYEGAMLARGRVALIKASAGADDDEPMMDLVDDPTLGWDRLAAGCIELIDVPGGHSTMLHAPCVQVLGERIGRLLQPAAAPVPGEPVPLQLIPAASACCSCSVPVLPEHCPNPERWRAASRARASARAVAIAPQPDSHPERRAS